MSSTFYDLNEVRDSMHRLIEALGLRPMLSEYSSFPVNPSVSTIENCLEQVRKHADIFVLICGTRYGSLTDSGHSVTNREYLEAVAKQIPIYAFVDKRILSLLPVWKVNRSKDLDLSTLVESPKLMEFVERLHDSGKQWVFPFDRAADIEQVLRSQLGMLFGEALEYRTKFQRIARRDFSELEGPALRLIADQPDGWESLLFSVVAKAEVEKHQELRYNLRHGLGAGIPVRVRPGELREWLTSKVNEFRRFMDLGKRLVDSAFPEAVGQPGQPGDPELLVRTARQIALLHKRILYWSLEYQDLTLDEEFEKLMSNASACAVCTLDNIEAFLDLIHTSIENQLKLTEEERTASSPPTCALSFSLSDEHLDTVVEELNRLTESGYVPKQPDNA